MVKSFCKWCGLNIHYDEELKKMVHTNRDWIHTHEAEPPDNHACRIARELKLSRVSPPEYHI